MKTQGKIGILSLQGGYKKHANVLSKLGRDGVFVRDVDDIDACSGLIIPGGESTTIGMLLKRRNLDSVLLDKMNQGMPIFGTCAGMILLAKTIDGRVEVSFNKLPIHIQRNAYGSQVDSFEADVDVRLADTTSVISAVFIRAPRIIECEKDVQVLAEFDGYPILVRYKNILASSFHPELTTHLDIHEYFCSMVDTYVQKGM